MYDGEGIMKERLSYAYYRFVGHGRIAAVILAIPSPVFWTIVVFGALILSAIFRIKLT